MNAFRPKQLWFILLLMFICTGPLSLMAQDSGKVDKLLRKADDYFAAYYVVDAEELYQEVLTLDPNNYRAAYQLGRINDYVKDYREALRWYRKASEIDPDRSDTLYLQIGLSYKRLANYRKAKEYFDEFKKRHTTQDELYQRAELETRGCDIAEASLSAQPEFRVKPVDFNSPHSDRFPSFLDQRQEDKFISFTSYRPLPKKKAKQDAASGEAKDSDIYFVVMENDSVYGDITRFPASSLFSKKINTKRNDGPATFTGDGLTMFFTQCNTKENADGCSIYESRYDPVAKEWGKPIFLEVVNGTKDVIINTRGKTKPEPTDDRQPFVTPDGRTLLFVSDRPGGQGGNDMWFSRRVGTGWSEPINLGETVNTPFNEATPFVNRTGDKLYFASEGLAGFGGYDLFFAEGAVGAWGEPTNLGAPINTSYNDFGSLWMDMDSTVLFTSDRPEGAGRDDIYWGRRIPRKAVKYDISVTGVIRDKDTKEPIPFATAILYLLEDGGRTVIDTFSTDQRARYEFALEAEQEYVVLGNAPDYLANEEAVSTMGIEQNTELVQNIDIELEPIIIGQAIALPNIYYDFDEYYLRADALIELKKLVKLLNDNSNIDIELGSHTDSNGTEPYNFTLSNNRAKAVVKFLAENEISPSRLTWFGYGESQMMIFPELSDEDEQANRRTEFRILNISFD
ncbi:MAG: OmpA family protein [Bacteroidia bacterium]|nr:OmpA family protein [Bacteroidia bacterium]